MEGMAGETETEEIKLGRQIPATTVPGQRNETNKDLPRPATTHGPSGPTASEASKGYDNRKPNRTWDEMIVDDEHVPASDTATREDRIPQPGTKDKQNTWTLVGAKHKKKNKLDPTPAQRHQMPRRHETPPREKETPQLTQGDATASRHPNMDRNKTRTGANRSERMEQAAPQRGVQEENEDLSDPEKSDDEEEPTEPATRQTYKVPIRVDLLPTEWNEKGQSSTWIKRVFAIVKHADKSAAILGTYYNEGRRKRYKEVSDIPPDGDNHFKIKRKQHRKKIRTLFAAIETALDPAEIRQLPGIRSLNTPTNVLRYDRYDGETTRSTGWLRGVHPTLTHSETLQTNLVNNINTITLPKEEVIRYQMKLSENDPIRKQKWDEVTTPCFHLTTEEHSYTEAGKKTKTKVMAIHTSESAAELITAAMAIISANGDIEFIPRTGKQSIGSENSTQAFKNHKKKTANLTAVAMYRIDPEVMTRRKRLPDGTMITLTDYIKRKTGSHSIERTNKTVTEGKFLLLIARETAPKTKKWVQEELPKYYRKFLTTDEREADLTGPMLAFKDDCSPQLGEWKNILIRRLQAEAESDNEGDNDSAPENYNIYNDGAETDDEDKFIITNKKLKLTENNAIRHKSPYSNPHYETDTRPPSPPPWTKPPEPQSERETTPEANRDINEAISSALAVEIPRAIAEHLDSLRDDIKKVEEKTEAKIKLASNKQTTENERNELERMINDLNVNLDIQRTETERINGELHAIRADNARAEASHQRHTEETNIQIAALGVTLQSHQTEAEKRNEIHRQLTEENMRKILHLNTAETRQERQRESTVQLQNIEKIFHDTKNFFVKETQKITTEFTQTVMDVKGLANRVHQIDQDLRASSEVAASASDYLVKATSDYVRPSGVEFETIVTPNQTPEKTGGGVHQQEQPSPPLGAAQTQC